MNYTKFFTLFFFICFVFTSCSDCSHSKVKNIKTYAKIFRFDSIFYAINNPKTAENDLNKVKNLDPTFMKIYANQIYNMGYDTLLPVENLFMHINSAQVIETKKRADSIFVNFREVKQKLDLVSKYYKLYYPSRNFPTIKTFYGGFAGFMAWFYDSSSLMVDLDMYLGSNFEAYPTFFPQYKYTYFNPEMLPINITKEIVRREMIPFETEKPKNMLAHIILEAAKFYELTKLMPCEKKPLLFEYTEAQWNWNIKEEKMIWQYIIKEKLLYESDYKTYRALVGEGPNTTRTGVAPNAPPRIGIWTGYQIIKSFFTNNKNVTSVQEMIKNYAPEQILTMAKYKP